MCHLLSTGEASTFSSANSAIPCAGIRHDVDILYAALRVFLLAFNGPSRRRSSSQQNPLTKYNPFVPQIVHPATKNKATKTIIYSKHDPHRISLTTTILRFDGKTKNNPDSQQKKRSPSKTEQPHHNTSSCFLQQRFERKK